MVGGETAEEVSQDSTTYNLTPFAAPPGKPTQNAYVESFSGKLADSCARRRACRRKHLRWLAIEDTGLGCLISTAMRARSLLRLDSTTIL